MAAVLRKRMLIDVAKCMGCRGCQVACKQWNGLPAEKTKFTGTYQNPPHLSGKTWTLVEFIEPAEGEVRWLFRKRQCMHCAEATCVNICPTGAAQRDEETGIVYIDQTICTGCKYCVESCPFGSVKFDHEKGTAQKCRLCIDRVKNNLTPACAQACPTGAITFGESKDILKLAKKRKNILERNEKIEEARIYGETELGGLGVVYLLPEAATTYQLPDKPKLPEKKLFLKWLLGIIPGAAIIYGMIQSMRNHQIEEGGE
jgi:formate dehydrogenase iron-sulfur subunit